MRTIIVATIALPLALLGWQWWGDRSIERELAPVASGVAGRDVTVDCQGFWSNLVDVQWRDGEVRFDANGVPEPRIFLTRSTCKRLRGFTNDTRHAQLDCLRSLDWSAADPLPFASACYADAADTIYAVLVLAHEAYHTAGVVEEATTNCYALQGIAWTAVELGAPREEAELIARAMEVLEPKQGPQYGTAECHAGLRLDLHPETPEFPTERELRAPSGRGGVSAVAPLPFAGLQA